MEQMSFCYLELLTIRQSLVFTQATGKGLDLSETIRKVDSLIKFASEKAGGNQELKITTV